MHKVFFKQLQKLIGVFFLLETLIGILIIVKNITNIIQVIAAAIVSIMFGTLSFLLLKNDSSKKKVKNSLKKCHENHIIIVINKIMASGLYPEKVV
mgnify:CR=1 FL=1